MERLKYISLVKELRQIAVARALALLDDRYLGRLFALRFTPNSRLSFFANANNVSDDRKPGQNGDWSPLRQATGIRSVYDAGFDYNIDEKDGHWSTSGNVRTSYTEDGSEQHTSSENFLTGGDTYGRAYSKRHTDNFKVRTNHEFNLYRRNNVFSYLGLRPDIIAVSTATANRLRLSSARTGPNNGARRGLTAS